jgi:hypothetical protein
MAAYRLLAQVLETCKKYGTLVRLSLKYRVFENVKAV